METMFLSSAVVLTNAQFYYMFPNAIRDFDETDAIGTKAFAGTDIFLGAGNIKSITLAPSLAITAPLIVEIFDAINEAAPPASTQTPIIGGAAPASRYKLTTNAAILGTKGPPAGGISPGPLVDPVIAASIAALAGLANARKLAGHQFNEFAAAGVQNATEWLCEVFVPHGIIIRIANISAGAVTFTAAAPLSISVDFERGTTGGTRRKHAARNAATHASKIGRSLSHVPLSV